MSITPEELAAAIKPISEALHNTLARTRSMYYGIDFAWVGYKDGYDRLVLLTATLSMSLDAEPIAFGGHSGRFMFQRSRLCDQNGDLWNSLYCIAAGEYVVPTAMNNWKLQFDAAGVYRTSDLSALCDEISVNKTWVQNEFPDMDWDRFVNDLQIGNATNHGSFHSVADLCHELGVEHPQTNRGIRTRILRHGALNAVRKPDGSVDLHVTLPAKADLKEARLQVYKGTRVGKPETLADRTKVVAGGDCIVTVPWTVGPTGKDIVQLMLADRPIARCEINDIMPHAHAYLGFDPGAETLRKFLLPPPLPTTSPKEWTNEQRDSASRFESACGTLLALLGFRVTPMGNLEKQGDWLVEHTVGGITVQFLVESRVALKDKIDLKKLAADARQLKTQQQFHVPAAVFTSVTGGTDMSFDGNAEVQHVRVLHKADLESLLALALDTVSESRTLEAFNRITDMMLV